MVVHVVAESGGHRWGSVVYDRFAPTGIEDDRARDEVGDSRQVVGHHDDGGAALAPEITEAIVEAALRYRGDRHSGASFATFVHLRAWGAMFDVERARRRSRVAAALSLEDTPVLPDLPLVGGAVLVRLQRLRLTRAERALLRALYVHGVAMQEYAAELGVHTSTVCRRHQHIMHRARRALTSARHSHHRR